MPAKFTKRLTAGKPSIGHLDLLGRQIDITEVDCSNLGSILFSEFLVEKSDGNYSVPVRPQH